MAQEGLEALLSRIRAAAWARDAAASRAWDALIALVLRRSATAADLELPPHRLVVLIEERIREDQQFDRRLQEWMSQYGTVARSGVVHNEINGGSISGAVIQGRDLHGNITFGDEMAARPPGPPFGDDDWDDETDDNA
ncbi:hypothetical protein SBI_04612 [Streptomyces bingchenggensis BCW-1]|uniref:Uncharacterized protein n=1 Tax=Streptomyces bingchenggensis (strain BCW-1) TaxID=749414 RepID=D7BXF9_STRBB|nr:MULTISPECIES: hypothetical protein [Streptomyces]ADI07732.1 hypothetical protein SBI_04612 [Streptomyces bingchenggensis BCW-1]